MRKRMVFTGMGVLLTGVLLLATAATSKAQTSPAETGSATFTVTAVGKKDTAPPIAKDDVQLSVGKERKQIGN